MSLARHASPILLLALGAGPGAAQGAAPGPAAPDAVRLRVEAGRRALATGDAAEAYGHFLEALVLAPRSPDVRAELLGALEGDADAARLWAWDWAAAASGAPGHPKTPSALAGGGRDAVARLEDRRAAAVDELLAFARARERKAKKAPEELLVALWARRLALALAAEAPSLHARLVDEVAPRLELPADFHEPLVAALRRLLGARGDSGLLVRAARVLAGLGAQAAMPGLRGPRPSGMERVRQEAEQALEAARAAQRSRGDEPWTVEQLAQLSPAERIAFTRRHASFADPGVALSPSGLYRIETDCGAETLLGVARTIELHHRRIARWFGSDPFVGRPGIVRIVPRCDGLEAEGAPYWWVGGMQIGDVTTVRFACGTIEELGHALTLELSRRFDTELHPGLPEWLVAGRAQWAAGAYAVSGDPELAPDHADFSTLRESAARGFDREERLRELVTDALADPREDYVAGSALYLYLETWEVEGSAPYRARLERFLQRSGAGKGGPLDAFVATFADGEEGRPAGFPAFAQAFADFLHGFSERDPAPWTARYHPVAAHGRDDYVYDEPTWVWSWRRAEPVFGEGEACLAAGVLEDAGDAADAARAGVLARAVDGCVPADARALARVLDGRDPDAAWAVRAELALGAPDGLVRLGGPPFARSLPRTAELRAAWAAAAEDWRGAGLALAADAVAADAGWLGTRLGIPCAWSAPEGDAARPLRHPFDPPARLLGDDGWVEDGLAGYEARHADDLWSVTPEGDLGLGARPTASPGAATAAALPQQAFVRSRAWVPAGAYRVHGRVRLVTGYARGALVVGWTARDHHVRVSFEAGDPLLARAKQGTEPSLGHVVWRIDGLHDREAELPGSAPTGVFVPERPTASFAFELLVDGATLSVAFDGRTIGSYHTPDGAPLEGFVGFATDQGAFVVQEPRIQRLERSRAAGRLAPVVLDVTRGSAPPFDELVGRSAIGFDPPPQGALVLWLPQARLDDALAGAHELAAALARAEATQPLVIALPDGLTEPERDRLRQGLDELGGGVRVVLHGSPADAAPAPDLGRRWALLVDGGGAVRRAESATGRSFRLSADFRHWLSVLREVGAPERELPTPHRDP